MTDETPFDALVRRELARDLGVAVGALSKREACWFHTAECEARAAELEREIRDAVTAVHALAPAVR